MISKGSPRRYQDVQGDTSEVRSTRGSLKELQQRHASNTKIRISVFLLPLTNPCLLLPVRVWCLLPADKILLLQRPAPLISCVCVNLLSGPRGECPRHSPPLLYIYLLLGYRFHKIIEKISLRLAFAMDNN